PPRRLIVSAIPVSVCSSVQLVTISPAAFITVTACVSAAQSQPINISPLLSSMPMLHLAVSRPYRRMLIVRPSIGHFPEGGHGASTVEGGKTGLSRSPATQTLAIPRRSPAIQTSNWPDITQDA